MVVSQAVRGTINMDKYATGHALKEIGVISGYDMTIEGDFEFHVTANFLSCSHQASIFVWQRLDFIRGQESHET